MTSTPPVTPEYRAENCGASLFNVSVTFAVLSTVFVCLFLVARYLKKTLLNLDVYFVLFSYAFTFALVILGIMNVKDAGAGRHVTAVISEGHSKIVLWLKIELAVQFTYIYGVMFPKLALLYLYLRIFNKPVYRNITYMTAAIVVANAIVMTIICFTICRPFAYNWDKSIPGGRCGDLYLLFKLASFPNIITDLVILILPIPVIWNLHTGTNQKIGLAITFLTGSFGMITAIVRLYQFFNTDLYSDMTYNSVTTMIWTLVEAGCYLIASILPSLRPLLRCISESRVYTYMQTHLNTTTTPAAATTRQKLPLDGSRGVALVCYDTCRLNDYVATRSGENLPSHKISIAQEFVIQRLDG